MFDCVIVSEMIFFCQPCWYYRSQGVVSRSADSPVKNVCAWADDPTDGGLLL